MIYNYKASDCLVTVAHCIPKNHILSKHRVKNTLKHHLMAKQMGKVPPWCTLGFHSTQVETAAHGIMQKVVTIRAIFIIHYFYLVLYGKLYDEHIQFVEDLLK